MAEPRGAQRRAQIIEGALAALHTAAVADVQLADIAEAAGMRPSHVLYYFESRDAVLVAAARHNEEALAEGRAERLASIDDPVERFVVYLDAYLPEDRHHPVWKLWIEAWLRGTEEFTRMDLAVHAGWLRDLAGTIEYAVERGASSPEAPREFAQRLLFLCDGLALRVLSGDLTPDQARSMALITVRRELRLDV